jgi:hypothetical protein
MSSREFRMLPYVSLKAVTLRCLLAGIVASVAHSQESPPPPTPHSGLILPGTHVAPRAEPQKPGIVLHIDGPTTVNKKKCAEHTFDIKYRVVNNTNEPANGTLRAMFSGASLTPLGSAKLNNLPPGKAASGAFAACCPSRGSFTAWIEYRDKPSTAHNKNTEDPYYGFDSLKISCTTNQ